jgi:hypothetical protein
MKDDNSNDEAEDANEAGLDVLTSLLDNLAVPLSGMPPWIVVLV